MTEHILILSQQAQRYRKLLQQADLGGARLSSFSQPQAALAQAADASVLFGDPDLVAALLPQLPAVRWVQSTWAGITPLLGCQRPDLRLTGVKGVFGPLMSEYVFTHLLAHERRVEEVRQAHARRQWQPLTPGTLRGKTLGLLGVGSIGAHLAATARGFGMTTFGCARTRQSAATVDRLFDAGELATMVAGVDYLVASLPSTPATRDLIDGPLLARFRPQALLINVGRGDLIDDQALIDALQSGTLAGAVLDVCRQEPLPSDHPFWRTPNLLVTAHTAAPSFPEDIAPLFIDNYQRYRSGQPLRHQVDFARGY